MNRIFAPLVLALWSAGCALTPRPQDVRATRAVPTAPAAEIITGRSEGQLESRGGCLYLTRDGPRRPIRLLVIWPLATRFNGSAIVPGQARQPQTFFVGEEVVIEGSAPDWAPYLLTTYPQLAIWRDRCGERPLFVGTLRRAD